MAFDKDFFSIQSDRMDVQGPAQNGCCPGFPDFQSYPGCSPNNTSQWIPYGPRSNLGSLAYSWFMPWPITIEQVIIVNFPQQYGGSDGAFASVARVTIDGVVRASKLWSPTDRQNDAGYVWDMNLFVPAEKTLSVTGQQYRQCNSTTINVFQVFITGHMLREY